MSTKLRIKGTLDQWIHEGKLWYDPETGDYTRLAEDLGDEPET